MLASLISGFASSEAAQAFRRLKFMAVAYLIAGLAVLTGLGFLIGAGYIAASRRFGPMEAAIGFGIGFIVLAGLVVLVFNMIANARERRERRRRASDMKSIGIAAAIAAAPVVLRNRAALGMLAVPALGLLAYRIFKENSGSSSNDLE